MPGADSRIYTAKVAGTSIGTFTVFNTEVSWAANTNYSIQNVVNWLNSIPGWSATLLNNSWAASNVSALAYVGSVSTNGGVITPAVDVKTAPVTFVARLYLHPEIYATETSFENIIIADNIAWNNNSQLIFGGATLKDYLILNNGITVSAHFVARCFRRQCGHHS